VSRFTAVSLYLSLHSLFTTVFIAVSLDCRLSLTEVSFFIAGSLHCTLSLLRSLFITLSLYGSVSPHCSLYPLHSLFIAVSLHYTLSLRRRLSSLQFPSIAVSLYCSVSLLHSPTPRGGRIFCHRKKWQMWRHSPETGTSFIWDMTHSHETWLIYMRHNYSIWDMTQYETWSDKCDVTHLRREKVTNVTSLIWDGNLGRNSAKTDPMWNNGDTWQTLVHEPVCITNKCDVTHPTLRREAGKKFG